MHVRATPEHGTHRSPGRSARGRLLFLLLGTMASVGIAHGVRELLEIRAAFAVTSPPPPAALDLVASLTNSRMIQVTTTSANWKKVRIRTTVHHVLYDRALWRQMHFEDWDGVPRDIREVALDLMVRSYAGVLRGPSAWRGMSIRDWDLVPQPVRAIAYLRMVAYWAVREQVGTAFDYEPRRVAQTIGAIVMAESWFEHRAVNQNEWGNRDLGLAQCSDYCRDELAAMADRGEIDFRTEDADYFNPLVATRVATVWLARELDRAGGDIEFAIRAYHRGIENAFDELGDAYLDRVLTMRRRYVRNVGAPPSWAHVVGRAQLFSATGGTGERQPADKRNEVIAR